MKDYIPYHAKCYFSTPDAAEPRNLTRELTQTLEGQRRTAGGFYDLERTYQPLYGQLGLDNAAQSMFGFDLDGQHHPGTLEMQRLGTQYQRGGDISDVEALGPRSTAAFLAANPFLADTLGNILGRTQDSQILGTLNDQANTALASGGQLSPQEERALEQVSRQAYADRGTLFGNQSIASELLNRDAAVRQRQQQAQNFAGAVQGMNQQQNDFTGRAAQIFGSTLSDPFQAILGRTSGAGGGGGGPQQQIGTGARLFDPTNPYANDIYSQNFNAQQSQNNAAANADNATTSAAINGVTSLLGAFLSDERIKKDIKDTGEKTKDGIPVKTFRYKTDKSKRKLKGVMAGDVVKKRPDAVIFDPISGLRAVDYKKIEAPFQSVEGKKSFDFIRGELLAA